MSERIFVGTFRGDAIYTDNAVIVEAFKYMEAEIQSLRETNNRLREALIEQAPR